MATDPGTNTEEIDVTDGKKLLYIVFGANRWEFEKVDGEEMRIPLDAEVCLNRMRDTVRFLLKNWKKISADERAMGEAGLTQELRDVKRYGFSIKGTLRYAMRPGTPDPRKYNAYLKILKDG